MAFSIGLQFSTFRTPRSLFKLHPIPLSLHLLISLSPLHRVSVSCVSLSLRHLVHYKKRGVVRGEYGRVSSQYRGNGRMSPKFLVQELPD